MGAEGGQLIEMGSVEVIRSKQVWLDYLVSKYARRNR